MNPRSLLLLPVLVITAPATNACTVASCTDDLRTYSVDVKRDISTPFAEAAKLSFEGCVGSGPQARCQTVQVVSGTLGTPGTLGALVQGTISELPGGKTRVAARLQVSEGAPSSSTPVSLRAKDALGVVVLEATGKVRWADETCHPAPLDSSI